MKITFPATLKFLTVFFLLFNGCGTETPSDIDASINGTEASNNQEVVSNNFKDNNSCFSVEELCKIVKDITVKEKKDLDDVFTIIKKERTLFTTMWNYNQKKDVLKIIKKAVKKAQNGGEYYSVYELCEIIKAKTKKEQKDIDDVFSILKKEDMLFETKWKYNQIEAVISLIDNAVKKSEVAGLYFSVYELCSMVKKMSKKANKDIDDVFTILKKEDVLFNQKWGYEHKEAVLKIIAGAIKSAGDA